jgi:uncharacterized protein
MKPTQLVAFASGVLFAIGLALSEMTRPEKVVAFLDLFGSWDPSLAFVMAGAVAVHMSFVAWARRTGARPRFAERFMVSGHRRVDMPLVGGALLFGLGWGAAGFCPGPALVALVTFAPKTLLFVGAMLAGMVLHAGTTRRATGESARESARSPAELQP